MSRNPQSFGLRMGDAMPAAMVPMQGFGMMPPQMGMFPQNSDATLFVGNLPPQMDEMQLFEICRRFGDVVSCKLMKDSYSGESREFAFVTYRRKEEAETAFLELNGYRSFNRALRVMYKKNVKDLNEKANLILRNLDGRVTVRQIIEECRKVGRVVSCVIRNDARDAAAVNYGYVQFEKEEDAQKFKEQFNGKVICDKPITVENFVPNNNRPKQTISNLYLKQFPSQWTKANIEKFINEDLAKFGKISSTGIFPRNDKFYAFVAFENADEAKAAQEKYNNWRAPGTPETDEALFVGPAMTKRTRQKMLASQKSMKKNETNLYIRSIRPEVTKEELQAVCESYGKVTSLMLKVWEPSTLPDQPPAKKLQFGFVNYENSEDAMKAFTSAKSDPAFKKLIDAPDSAGFIFFAQSKKMREQYLRMQKANQLMMFSIRQQKMPMMPPGIMGGMPGRRGKRGGMGQQMPPLNMDLNILPPTSLIPPVTPPKTVTPPEPAAKLDLQKRCDNAQSPRDFCNLIRNNLEEFMSFDDSKKKKILGNMMFKRVRSVSSDDKIWPKITGMLIDWGVLEISEILEIIEDEETLRDRVAEATSIINSTD